MASTTATTPATAPTTTAPVASATTTVTATTTATVVATSLKELPLTTAAAAAFLPLGLATARFLTGRHGCGRNSWSSMTGMSSSSR